MASAVVGKKLREAVADRSGPTSNALANINAMLAPETESDVSKIVNDANRNDKRPIHFAAQLRSDTEVLARLIALKADVNASTHRGAERSARQRIDAPMR